MNVEIGKELPDEHSAKAKYQPIADDVWVFSNRLGLLSSQGRQALSSPVAGPLGGPHLILAGLAGRTARD